MNSSPPRSTHHPPQGTGPDSDPEMVAVDLSSRRTGKSFQRTRMSADRTLMSVIRTALSLITFGFTIYQTFHHLHEANVIHGNTAALRFGVALLLLSVGLPAGGVVYQLYFMRGLRRERRRMKAAGLIYAESTYPVALSLVVAIVLLAIGVFVVISSLFRAGPFG